MGTDRGLPPVPRGLERGLTQYLQASDTMMRRIAGVVRGSAQSRAVRASETATTLTAFGGGGGVSSGVDIGAIALQILRDGSVTERKIADGSVTSTKLGRYSVTRRSIAPGEVIENALREGCVTSGKLANGAVTATRIAPEAVGTSALADGSVTAEKLADGVFTERPESPALPTWVSGDAKHGEIVSIPGKWIGQPLLFLGYCSIPVPSPDTKEGEDSWLQCGPGSLVECCDAQGAGTGEWSFIAHGNFTWAAMGKAKEVSV